MQLSTEKNPTLKTLERVERKAPSETETAGTAKVLENKDVPIVHKGFSTEDIRQKYVQYAYKLGGMDFVTMLECENGQWRLDARGDWGKAYWLCQINTNYHKLPEWYLDVWQVQVEYCYQKWSTHTVFYWPNRKIKGVKCSKYVLDRFIINDVNNSNQENR